MSTRRHSFVGRRPQSFVGMSLWKLFSVESGNKVNTMNKQN
jgi:hypothetical protein